jgi:RNA polymerase sigma-70 factor (ECF subfamily)
VESDARLVNAALNGQKEAFAVLVKRYERPVRLVALNVLHEYHLASDASQDAFVQAFENLIALRKADAFGPWLMKITHRCALDTIRKRARLAPLDITAADAAIEKRNGQLDEDKQRVLAAVVKLPKAERQVIMLRYFSGHSVRDVSEIVGRSVGTVTKQLSRAHKRLRKLLKEV